MDKHREIYRKLIYSLFKENFEAALFEEKHNEMMNEQEFQTIRDDIEEEYFIKNRGIVPYLNAMKYLQAKIETCTFSNQLFAALEDYICAKEKIVITKIPQVPTIVEPEKVKTVKRKKQPSKDTSDKLQPHSECKTPQSCKKCRIMRRLARLEIQPQKLNRKKVKKVNDSPSLDETKNNPKYSDISDSEATSASSSSPSVASSVISSTSVVPAANEERIGQQLPYLDHQYSRISFYGSGINEESNSGVDGNAAKSELSCTIIKPTPKPAEYAGQSLLKSHRRPMPNLMPTLHFPYRFKQNNGLRQTAPTYAPHNTRNTLVNTPTIIRPIPQRSNSVFVTSQMPINFSSPVTVLQGSMIHQPIYYVVNQHTMNFSK